MIFQREHGALEQEVDLPDLSADCAKAMAAFRSDDEVRFDEASLILPALCNVLTVRQEKFYLIHLPGGAGWVLRRHRPTGQFYGKPTS